MYQLRDTPPVGAVVPSEMMKAQGRGHGARLAALALAAAVVAPGAPALAHQGGMEQHRELAGGLVAVLALALAVLLGASARGQRALPLILALVLGVFPYEAGLHSVHHLGSLEGAAQCAVAGVTSHLAATVDGPTVTLAGPDAAVAVPAADDITRAPLRAWPAWRGRAPPALPAV